MKLFSTLVILLAASPIFAKFESEFLSVETKGAGPDVILIHGFGCSPDVWSGFVEEFEESYRLHLVALAGHASEPPAENEPNSYLDKYRDEIARYITEEDLEKPTLIGHSMGGLISMLVAAENLDLPGRLVVVDSLPFFSLIFNPFATSEQAEPQAKLAEKQLLNADPEQFEKQASASISILAKSDEGQERLLGWSNQCDRVTYARCMRELITRDARPDLDKIICPVTVLYAYDDGMGIPENFARTLNSTSYAKLKVANLVMIPDSYHFIMWDQPGEFHEAVKKALAE